MTDEVFGAHKNSVVIKKSQKDRELVTETNRYWEDIISNTFVFERSKLIYLSILFIFTLLINFLIYYSEELLIEEIKKVTKDEIIEMYKTTICDNPERKLLVIAGYSLLL